ncbi:hypothetical protein Tco_1094314 [Tanacetum coccineum]|uniref:Uncharacterized protein n=1 Tax=Tanacetum coccineum TaxID=301880 RepID=A0ABQ5IF60_9ASTR
MMVQALKEMGEGSASPTEPHHTPITIQPSTSQLQKKQKPRKPKRKDTEVPQPSGPTINVADEAFTEENATKHSNDPMLKSIDLETPKTTQGSEIASLKRRVKKLEKKNKSRTHKLKRLYKVSLSRRVESSDEASLGDQEDASKQGRKIDDLMFDTGVLNDEKVVAGQDMDEKEVSTADPVTIASEVVTTANVEDKIETDYEMAQRLQAEEQEELTIEEKSKLFVQLLEARKKHFASKRAEEKRNKPPTKAQQRSIMYDGDDVTIEATPLSTKSPTIVDYKVYKEGKKSYFSKLVKQW